MWNKNKYKAKRTNGFSSALESSTFDWLLRLEIENFIFEIRKQHRVDMTDALISWKIDFSFKMRKSGGLCYLESKGIETADYRIKKKLFQHYGDAPLIIVKGSARRPTATEIIRPPCVTIEHFDEARSIFGG